VRALLSRPALRARVAGLFLFALATPSSGCERASAADEIRGVIRASAGAASKHDVRGVLAPFADDFCGARRDGPLLGRTRSGSGCGGLTRADVRRAVTAQLLPKGWVRVFIPNLDVEVEGAARAAVTVDAVLARGTEVERLEDLLPADGDAFRFDLALERRAGDWLIVSGRMARRRFP
jgi:hypothetical protein